MRPLRPLRSLALVVLTAFLGSCGRSEEEPPLPLRWIDERAAVEIRGLSGPPQIEERFFGARRPVGLLDPGRVRTETGRVVARRSGDADEEWAAGGAARFGEEDSRGFLELEGPAAAWVSLEAGEGKGAASVVRVLAAGEEEADWRLVLARPPESNESGAVLDRLRFGGIDVARGLLPEEPVVPGRAAWYRSGRDPSSPALLGLFVRRGRVRVLAAEEAVPTALGRALFGSEVLDRRRTYVRRAPLMADQREAFLVPIGAELAGPAGGPALRRLRFAWGTFGEARRVELRLFAVAPDGAERLVWSPEEPPPDKPPHRWIDERVELPEGDWRALVFRVGGEGAEALVGVAHPTLLPEARAEGPAAPDVVLVSLDTVRADRLAAWGADRPTSPRLAELAGETCVFEAAVAPASWTLPSHVTVFTGWLPDRHDVIDAARRIPDEAPPLLAERLRRRGYRCVALTAGGFVAPELGFARGFEEYRVVDPVDPRHLPEGPAHLWSKMARHRIAELIGESDRSEPLFLFVHTYAAHEYAPSDEDLRALGLDDEEIRRAREVSLDEVRRRVRAGEEVPDDWRRALADRYDATLRAADRLAGEVADTLRAAGRWDDALFVVFSDHGEELFEHGGFGHAHALHEELLRVPLLLRAPGLAPGRFAEVVSLADVFPTLAELLDLPGAEDTDGRSLLPLLRGERPPERPALAAGGAPWSTWQHALRGRRFKLLRIDERGGRKEMLYDLAAAGESEDVAVRHPDTLRRMARLLDAWLERLRSRRLGAARSALGEARRRELEALGYLGGD